MCTDVVDQARARCDGFPRHLGLVGVDGDCYPRLSSQPLKNGQYPTQFLYRLHRLGIRPSALAPDVQDFRAVRLELKRVVNSRGGIKELPTIGKRVWGDIDDPHEDGRPGK